MTNVEERRLCLYIDKMSKATNKKCCVQQANYVTLKKYGIILNLNLKILYNGIIIENVDFKYNVIVII